MSSVIFAAVAVVLAQAAPPGTEATAPRWCFDRGQDAQLCEQTESECNHLRDINMEIAKGPCKPVKLPAIQKPLTETPAPLNPQATPPTQR